MSRVTVLRGLAVVFALAMWIPALGLVDLIAPWFLGKSTLVSDLGYGAITGLIVPAGLLAQLRRPARTVAGLQQVAAAALAYAAAGIVSDRGYLVLAALVAAGVVVLLFLHPTGGTFLAVPDDASPLLVGLALLAGVPFVLYALENAEDQRNGVGVLDFHAGLDSRGGLAAMGFGIALVALLAAIRTTGWRVPAWSASGAAAIWGIGCVAYPESAGSEGSVWGALAIVWALAFVLAARYEARAFRAYGVGQSGSSSIPTASATRFT